MGTSLLTAEEVDAHADMEEVIAAVRTAFGAYGIGSAIMPAKSYIDLPKYHGDFRSMPAYLQTPDWDAAGVKWVNVHPDNPETKDLPTVMALFIYSDPATGYPLAIMDGTRLTQLRTGAAAAVASDYLAIDSASTMGIIGAGAQAYTQLRAISEVRNINEVRIHDIDDRAVTAFETTFSDQFEVRAGSLSDVGHCDIVSTVTPVENPILAPEHVGETTHINAIGADARGKQELADEVLLDAKIVIDDLDQAVHSGEINVPWNEGTLEQSDIFAELGEQVAGEKPGRMAYDDVTVFDSTGLAIQDVATAHVVYETVVNEGTNNSVDLVDVE